MTTSTTELLRQARAAAEGTATDPDRIASAVDACGRTFDTFEADVAKLLERHRLRAELDTVPDLEAQRQGVEAEIAGHDRDLQAAVDRHAAATAPLKLRVAELRDRISHARTAERGLKQTAPADRVELHRRVEAERAAAVAALADLRKAVENAREAISYDPGALPSYTSARGEHEHRHVVAAREAKARAERKLPKLTADLATAEQRVADLDRQLAEASAALLNP